MRIVVIISDTFRYDNLGFVQGRAKTPELDTLCAQSTFFDNYSIGSFPTIPNRTDYMTGQYQFLFGGWQPLDPNKPVLAELLKNNGYINQMIVDTPHLFKRGYDFDRGFHGYLWNRGQEGDIYFTRMNYDIEEVMPEDKTRSYPVVFGHVLGNLSQWIHRDWQWEEDCFMVQTARTASRWIEENYTCEDFLLWLDFFDVHEPWDPPEFFVKAYDPDYTGSPMVHPNYGPADIYTPEELRNLQAHYLGEVTLLSKWIGMVLRKLEDTGIYDDTLIMFSTDHGIFTGEHGVTGKSRLYKDLGEGVFPFYNELTHIPLSIKLPGQKNYAHLP
jgi:arylsulfatase A-like enzyme